MYRFNFDGYLGGDACGWVFNLDKPSIPIEVGVYLDGELVVSGFADRYREDLLLAGIGSCAFALPVGLGVTGSLEVRILADGTLLPGSGRSLVAADPIVSRLLKRNKFSTYIQFQVENLKINDGTVRAPKQPVRLSRVYSRTVAEVAGIRYSAHMNWVCSRERRGAPSFFSRKRTDPLDDLYWYLFECREPSKSIADFDYETINTLIFPQGFGLKHHTVLFALWLHRTGRQLANIKIDGLKANFEFCAALLNANSQVPLGDSYIKLSKLARVQTNDPLAAVLPSISNYLLRKYEENYSAHYSLFDVDSYLEFIFDCLLHVNTARELEFFGRDILSFFQSPVEMQDGVVSRFAMLCYEFAALVSSRQQSDLSQLSSLKIKKWFEDVWLPLHPIHHNFRLQVGEVRADEVNIPFCYIVANWTATSGLTQNALMSTKTLVEAGIPVIQLFPDGSFFGRLEVTPSAAEVVLNRDIVLLHVNADDAPSALYKISGWVDLDLAFIIGYFLWELGAIPEAHRLGVDLVDEIWVPTDFVLQAYRSVAKDKVHRVGKGITVPCVSSVDRKIFGLDNKSKVFLVSFDFHSSVERKNPLAAIKAFQMAFVDRDDVRLVVKSTPFQVDHWGDPFDQWGMIAECISVDSRIILIDEFLGNREMFELLMVADVIVSSHRSEGFGYLPAYGLLLGKQIVVTGYGGTSDYCNDKNSHIANFDLVNVPNDRFIYPLIDAVWAEVDVSSLAKCMTDSLDPERFKFASQKIRKGRAKQSTNADLFSYLELKKIYLERLFQVKAIENKLIL